MIRGEWHRLGGRFFDHVGPLLVYSGGGVCQCMEIFGVGCLYVGGLFPLGGASWHGCVRGVAVLFVSFAFDHPI